MLDVRRKEHHDLANKYVQSSISLYKTVLRRRNVLHSKQTQMNTVARMYNTSNEFVLRL